MASIRKYKTGWRAEVCVNKIRDSKIFSLKSDAQQWANDREEEIHSGKINSSLYITLAEIYARYAREISPKKKGERWEKIRLKALAGDSIAEKRLLDLKQADWVQWRNKRATQVSGSTVNREMNLISSVLSHCINEWHLLEENPLKGVRRPPNAEARERRINQTEIERLNLAIEYRGEVKSKQHRTVVAFMLAIETAMRLGEIVKLRSEDVNGRVALLGETKNGSPRSVPLSSRALELLDKHAFELLTFE